MKFLIDANIFIPLEPTSTNDVEGNTPLALQFQKLVTLSKNQVLLHPYISADLINDKDHNRKKIRQTLISRYPLIDSPPDPSILDPGIISIASQGSHDWVDNCLLAALFVDSVDYLVTEDIQIHKKAKKINLDTRVLFLVDAIALLQDLFDVAPKPPPTVAKVYVYELNTKDPIFDTLRIDYEGEKFDQWLSKCKLEHRSAYITKSVDDQLAGVVILKPEKNLPNGQKGKILKICTFKISEEHSGNKLGELLLKSVFEYVKENKYEYCYFTSFSKQTQLISFASDFGFLEIENFDSREELALCKSFRYTDSEIGSMPPLEFHKKYGPFITSFYDNSSFIVPILPHFHMTLFPELGATPKSLFEEKPKPCGNSIRKAYLCHAQTKKIAPGDNLFFYRSTDLCSITVLGIVEATLRSKSPDEIARFVGKRTVYAYHQIEEMCSEKEVLAILFRQVAEVAPHLPLRKLRTNDILKPKANPQSIFEINALGVKWLREQIKM